MSPAWLPRSYAVRPPKSAGVDTGRQGVRLTPAGFDGQAPEKRKKGRASEPKTPDVSTATGMMW